MKKGLVILSLTTILLASCSSSKNQTIEAQLANDYNFTTLNVELNDFEDIYQDSIKSGFLVLNCIETAKGLQITSTGSGFAYKEVDGVFYIITNNHVAPNNTRIYNVVTYTGQILPATLIGTGDNYLDISVLKVENLVDMQTAKIYCNGDYKLMEVPNVGDSVYALGNPADINLFGSIAHGVVSSGKRSIKTNPNDDLMQQEHAIQIDLPINPGNSGGPLYNDKGEVIGVNTFKLTKDNTNENLTGVNFSLPIHDMVIAADYIISNYNGDLVHYKPFGFGNVRFTDVKSLSLYDRKKYKIPDNILDGVYIIYSGNDTLEDKCIVTKINDTKVTDSFDLKHGLVEVQKNKVNLELLSLDGVTTSVEVTLSL